MKRYYIFEILFILLGLALLATVIKYPKEIILKLPWEILKLLLRVILRPFGILLLIIVTPLLFLAKRNKWAIAGPLEKLSNRIYWDSGSSNDDEPYHSSKNLKVNFIEGEKYIQIIQSNQVIEKLIEESLELLQGQHSKNEFSLSGKGTSSLITMPHTISFFDFHLLVQHFHSELGSRNSFGIYRSEKITYYVFQDLETTNNLIGITSTKKLFSIYMLDDLEENQYLKLNQKLKVDTAWLGITDLSPG